MTGPFVVISVGVFTGAFGLGWWRYRSYFWNWVDLLYYPLAAIGVAFLFLSNDVQRELLDVAELAEQQRLALARHREMRPVVEVLEAESLFQANLEHVALIERWIEICHGGPSAAEARCLAVKDLGPQVQDFLGVARTAYPNYTDRLIATCSAGDKLMEELRTSGSMSSAVAEKMAARYATAISLKLHPLDFEGVRRQIDEFKQETTQYVETIHRAAFKIDDSSSRLFHDIQMAQIGYAEIVLYGLSQCMSAPRADLDVLKKWTVQDTSQEKQVAQAEAKRSALRQSITKHTTSLWLQLNLWPLVLLAGLSLKFAKGAAGLRKARAS